MASETVGNNKVVAFTYVILDQQGDLFEQSDLAVEYIHGVPNNMFKKVEQALTGKTVGDSVQVQLAPQNGFGKKNTALIFTQEIENAPLEYRVVGAKPIFQNDKGVMVEMTVTYVDDEKIVVDGNHPLAEQTVTFKVKIIEIRQASAEELTNQAPNSPPPALLQ